MVKSVIIIMVVLLFPFNIYAEKGDIDGQNSVTLSDIILSLQIVNGMSITMTPSISEVDVNHNSRIGLEESIYILRFLAGLIPQEIKPGDCLTSEEVKLANLVNQYRVENNLPEVPISKSLSMTAQWHVIDLNQNNPVTSSCNLHSWSDKQPDLWTPVCYTDDHANISGMWKKPREITNNIYTGNGYENASMSSGQITALTAFNLWKGDPGHNDIILERGIWEDMNWPAMGVGIYEHYAVLWFGDKPDVQASLGQCSEK